ncbi:hypothetical protein FACS1894105_04170 [Clostridia bacterium]|nr:hypothetical protein FACS1894105_04170 [Clostridia bacterium]
MQHTLKIGISEDVPIGHGVVNCRTVDLREKIMRVLFGKKQRVTILVPGNSVKSLSIQEIQEGDENDANERTVSRA